MKLNSREILCSHVNNGNKVKYIFFWGHLNHNKYITQSCLSQWYDAPFEVAGIVYKTAEHYMMAKKAKLFESFDLEQRIIAAKTPGEAKKLGREIEGFDEDIWVEQRFNIVVAANIAKFSQHAEEKQYLVNTEGKILVEASPLDRIWGVGLAADDPVIQNPNLWNGLNLLGFALMEVRDRLSEGLMRP